MREILFGAVGNTLTTLSGLFVARLFGWDELHTNLFVGAWFVATILMWIVVNRTLGRAAATSGGKHPHLGAWPVVGFALLNVAAFFIVVYLFSPISPFRDELSTVRLYADVVKKSVPVLRVASEYEASFSAHAPQFEVEHVRVTCILDGSTGTIEKSIEASKLTQGTTEITFPLFAGTDELASWSNDRDWAVFYRDGADGPIDVPVSPTSESATEAGGVAGHYVQARFAVHDHRFGVRHRTKLEGAQPGVTNVFFVELGALSAKHGATIELLSHERCIPLFWLLDRDEHAGRAAKQLADTLVRCVPVSSVDWASGVRQVHVCTLPPTQARGIVAVQFVRLRIGRTATPTPAGAGQTRR